MKRLVFGLTLVGIIFGAGLWMWHRYRLASTMKRLMMAIETDDPRALQTLLSQNPQAVNLTTTDGVPLLLEATLANRYRIVALLLTRYHADPNATDADGETPLEIGAQWGNTHLKGRFPVS